MNDRVLDQNTIYDWLETWQKSKIYDVTVSFKNRENEIWKRMMNLYVVLLFETSKHNIRGTRRYNPSGNLPYTK